MTILSEVDSKTVEELTSELIEAEPVIEVWTNIPFKSKENENVDTNYYEINEQLKKGPMSLTYIKLERLLRQGIVYLDNFPHNPERRIWKEQLTKDNLPLYEFIGNYNLLSRKVIGNVNLVASFLCGENHEAIDKLSQFTKEGEKTSHLSELHNRTDRRRKAIALERRTGLLSDEILANTREEESSQETDSSLARIYLTIQLQRENFDGDINEEVKRLMASGKPEYTSFNSIVEIERKQYLENLTQEQRTFIAKEVDRTLAAEYHRERLQREGFEGDEDQEIQRLIDTGEPQYTSFIYISGMETKQYLADFVALTEGLNFDYE